MHQFHFRSHHNDAMDVYIISACMDNVDLDEITTKPLNDPLFSVMNDKAKSGWIANVLDHTIFPVIFLT